LPDTSLDSALTWVTVWFGLDRLLVGFDEAPLVLSLRFLEVADSSLALLPPRLLPSAACSFSTFAQ
jgi:hypothetical protein